MKFQLGLILVASAGMLSAAENDTIRRLDTAGRVFDEIMTAPDRGVPRDLLERAECVGIIPGLKRAGFIVGGRYGKGFITCRDANTASGWSGPAAVRIEGGSFGAQIGAGETDVVLVVLNKEGMRKLMKSDFTLGADAGVMAGPVGREAAAQTDALMHAQILSYSRSRGVFAGVTLNGATLRPDAQDNRELYGRDVSEEDVLLGRVNPPAAARNFYSLLNRYASASGEAAREKTTTPERANPPKRKY